MNVVLSTQISDIQQKVSEIQVEFRQQALNVKSYRQIDYGTEDSFLPVSYGRDLELCEQGTRVGILATIRQWASGDSSNKQIFWIRDAAGTGKSTVAATMADEWIRSNRLAARFFFSPNSSATSVISHFCVTLAKDMAVQIPSLASMIGRVLRDSPTVHFNFRLQLERLVIEPLQKAPPPHPLFLVVDGVDNCEQEGRGMLLEALLSCLPSANNVRLLLTSRPLPDIDSILADSELVQGRDIQLLDIHDRAYDDITLYVNKRLQRLTLEQRQTVIVNSGGLFIWAATACRMLKKSRRPAELLTQLLQAETHGHLDKLYLEALQQALTDPSAHELMMGILRFIIVAFQPISINTIQAFLPSNGDVDNFVQDLGGVLKDGHPDRPIFVIHPTFREFISHDDRANGFLVDIPLSHGRLAIACVDLLASLEYDALDVCQTGEVLPVNTEVGDLVAKVDERMNAAMKYASSYWAHHTAACGNNLEVWEKVIEFLETKLLEWVETMSWRGNMIGCLEGLSKLFFTSKSTQVVDSQLLTRSDKLKIGHAYQFVLQNQNLLHQSALHAYSTPLAFSPKDSPLLQSFQARFGSKMPRVISTTDVHWPTHQILTGHSNICQIELSSDGSRIVTRSEDGTLHLWDTETGSIIAKTEKNNDASVVHFTLSKDGEHFGFGTKLNEVHVWDLRSGTQRGRSITVSRGTIFQMEFLHKKPLIMIGTRDQANEIQIWDWEQGEKTSDMNLEGTVHCFAVSPDGKRLVSICGHRSKYPDVVVELWDLESWDDLANYEMPRIGSNLCIAFDHVNNHFITWDAEGSIYLRQCTRGRPVKVIKAHTRGVAGAMFSPTGTNIASYGMFDASLTLWDIHNMDSSIQLEGHTEQVRYIGFTSDGSQLASMSSDQTIRVWDTNTGTPLQSIFKGFTGNVGLRILSPDWSKFIAVGSTDEISIYDLSSGAEGLSTPEAKFSFANPHVAFSPSDRLLVCGYDEVRQGEEPSLQLWDLETATPVGKRMVGHAHGISAVTFSPDGRRIASGSKDGMVLLWNTLTQSTLGQPMIGHTQYIQCLTFSPDGRQLSSSSFELISVWDTESTVKIWSIRREMNNTVVAFSPEGTEIAGISSIEDDTEDPSNLVKRRQKIICIWDYITGEVKSAQINDTYTNKFAFSPVEIYLASSHHICIRLWEVDDVLTQLAEITIPSELQWGYITGLYPMGFSSDGTLLVYGHSIWNITSLPPTPLGSHGRLSSVLGPEGYQHSLLTYIDGWIYSAWPRGRLLPTPQHLKSQFQRWNAYRAQIVVWTQSQTPIIIDCSPLMSKPE